MAKQSDIDKAMEKMNDFSSVINKVNKTVIEVEKESNSTKQYTDRRIEGNRDIIMKHTEQIE